MFKKITLKHFAAAFGVFIALGAVALYAYELSFLDNFAYFANHVPGGDYRSFWPAARMVWFGEAAGAYKTDAFSAMTATITPVPLYLRLGTMYYPPTYLLFLAPFGLLDYMASHIAFFLCGLLLFLTTLWVITGQRWFVIFMLCFTGIWINLAAGQNGLYTASLFGLGFALLRRHPVAAGICFGLLTMKPHLGVLIPVALIAARAWKTIGVAAITALVLAILAAVLFGADIWTLGITGFFTASFNLAQSTHLWARIPSLFSTLRLSGFEPGQAMLLQLSLFIPIGIIVWLVWRRSQNLNLNAVVSSCAALIVLPFFYDYDMALLGIALAFLAVEISRKGWWLPERLVLPFIIIWPIFVNKISIGGTIQLGLLGPLLLMILAIRRIIKERKVAPVPAPALNTAV